jgi:hypothetical protein
MRRTLVPNDNATSAAFPAANVVGDVANGANRDAAIHAVPARSTVLPCALEKEIGAEHHPAEQQKA